MNMVYLREGDIPRNPADPSPADARPSRDPDACTEYFLQDQTVCLLDRASVLSSCCLVPQNWKVCFGLVYIPRWAAVAVSCYVSHGLMHAVAILDAAFLPSPFYGFKIRQLRDIPPSPPGGAYHTRGNGNGCGA
jgi:hypothetical protein